VKKQKEIRHIQNELPALINLHLARSSAS